MNGFFGQPAVRPVTVDDERAVDAAAELAGFAQREPLKPVPKRRRGTRAQLHNFTMRLAVDDVERFIRYAEKERLSYREVFSLLVRKIE